MGSKCLKISTIVVLLTCILSACATLHNSKEDYTNKLQTELTQSHEITVQDIFSFEFDRAYVFDDCYISGAGFAKKYELNISIDEVQTGTSENIQRIVFVDAMGYLVYEFRCDSNEISIPEKGMIIYPETVISKDNSYHGTPIVIFFESTDFY